MCPNLACGDATVGTCAAGSPLARSSTRFDGFGRPTSSACCAPAACWSQRFTRRNTLGWVTRVSELLPCNGPGVAPSVTLDSSTNSTDHQWLRPVRPAAVGPGARPDEHGPDLDRRAASSSAPSRSPAPRPPRPRPTTARGGWQRHRAVGLRRTVTTTSYTYDVGNRLTQATTGTQTRSFSYDFRGFLKSETLPELGPGTATYGESASAPSYDARGHATKRFDGQHRLLLAYDRAERLVRSRRPTPPGPRSAP